MVIGAAKILINILLQYPFVTHWLYIPRFLGLNMIEPSKSLIDSGLAVRFLSVSNKMATKATKKAPFRVLVKINLLNPSHDVAAKVSIFFDLTKNRHISRCSGKTINN